MSMLLKKDMYKLFLANGVSNVGLSVGHHFCQTGQLMDVLPWNVSFPAQDEL